MLQYLVILYILHFISADTPANCTYQDAVGTWQLYTGSISSNCSLSKLTPTKKLTLIYPNLVEDEFGNIGTWTLIYNQGFEAVVNNVKYFGFFDYKKVNSAFTISYCNRLQPMSYHDVLIRQWKCFTALKVNQLLDKSNSLPGSNLYLLTAIRYGSQKKVVDHVNSLNLGWKTHDYEEFHDRTLHNMINMAGGPHFKLNRPATAPISNQIEESVGVLPRSFDWRNIRGINYVSPVRNQMNCGSCYSFASAAMLEARYRIRSNNTVAPFLSSQDVVECSPFSQGCDGGFPYLIAGKYAEDFGMASESCNPYKGVDGKCSTTRDCKRYYATKYRYVGGFYGGCNEPLMRQELVKNGPIAVGFMVYPDFMSYRSGVYHHDSRVQGLTQSRFGFNPFELTNHAVLVVGYGQTDSGVKFWTVKNSWGASWGESGYFRIRRTNDECGIESLAVASEPIL